MCIRAGMIASSRTSILNHRVIAARPPRLATATPGNIVPLILTVYGGEVILDGVRVRTAYRREPTAYRREPTAYRREPTAYRREPTACRREPTAYRREPTAYPRICLAIVCSCRFEVPS